MIDFDQLTKAYLEKNYTPKYSMLKSKLASIEKISPPTDLSKFKLFYRNLDALRRSIEQITIDLQATDLKSDIQQSFDKELDEHQNKEHAIHQKYEQLIDAKKNELHEEAILHNNNVTAEWAAQNEVYVRLENKRKTLLQYSDSVQKMCDQYGIVSSDCNLTEKDFTVESLGTEYERSINFLSKRKAPVNLITLMKAKIPNVYAQVGILLVALLSCFTPALDIVSICLLGYIFIKQFGMGNVVKTYAKIYGLMYNVQPLNMGYTESVPTEELESTDVGDEDTRLDDLAEAWENELDELDKQDPEEELKQANLEYAKLYSDIKKEFEMKSTEFRLLKSDVMGALNKLQQVAEANEKEAKSKVKYLCERFKTDYVLDTNFTLGLKDDNIEEFYDIGNRNVIIRPGHDPKLLATFMQVLVANLFLNVKGNLMDITVIDPNSRCKDYMMFYQQKLTDVNLHLNEETLSTELNNVMEFMDKNMKEMHGLDIAAYNKQCQERNAAPREYRVIIVASQPKEIVEKEEWMETLRSSAQFGVIFFVITDADMSRIEDDVCIFNRPFDYVSTPYALNIGTFAEKFKECYASLLKKSKLPPLTYSTFMNQTFPENKRWWKRRELAKTDKSLKEFDNNFIHVCPGYYEGDPGKPDEYTFGHQGNVHVIGVGGTGAGKSVFLNFLILQLCTMYSPEELELWLVDFKGAEFTKYIASPLNDFKALPHVKACLCTSDGDFAGSLYAAFKEDAEQRYAMFSEMGCKSLKEYNEKMTRQGHPEKRLPRIVMINDEFQVIFQKADDKVLSQIKVDMGYVAKLGRASGHHLFFTSQSMSGTLSADILTQFTLRFVLRCDAEVSTNVLGNKAAAAIKEPNGFLYTRSYDNDWANNPPRYRTPFIDDERPVDQYGNETGEMSQVEKAICTIYDEAKKIGFKQSRVITYNEKTTHDIEEINKFYKDNESRGEELRDLFVLGPSMTYTKSIAPQHLKLTAKNNTHIFSSFSDYADLINFYKTIMYNIKCAVSACDFIVNSQVADLHYLCELDIDVPEDLQEISNEKTSAKDFIEIVQDIYKSRVENEAKSKPLYIICVGWDKASGFGVEKDSVLVSRMQVLLQKCAEYHIHFIFICNTAGSVPPQVVNVCKYRICGKSDENTSYNVIGTKQAYKAEMKSGFFYLFDDGAITRGKVYQYKSTRKVASDKLSF